MLFVAPPTPKQLQQFSSSGQSSPIAIPDRWENFVPMLTIRSGSGSQCFTPFPMQVKLSDLVDKHPFSMMPKTRQLGISQWALSKILHEMLKRAGINCVVVSHRNLDAYKLGRRMIQMIDSAFIPTIRKSAAEIVLFNESRCIFAEPGDNSGRSEDSVSIVLLDEFGHYSEPELTMGSVMPTMSMVDNAKLWVIFTPNGKSHFSYQILDTANPSHIDTIATIKDVREGLLPPLYWWVDNDGWCKILIHWRSHPKYSQDPDYLKSVAKKTKLPWRKVLREYDLSFDESELQYIPDEIIDGCATGECEPPQEDGQYYAGLDTSSVGSDYFCFSILKDEGKRLSLVHLYRARRRSMKRHLVRIGDLCQRYAIISAQVETNSFGQLYYEELSASQPDIDWQRFNASNRTNAELFERMLMRMEEKTIAYPQDSTVLKEFRGLEQDPVSGKIEAAKTGLSGDSDDEELHDDIPRSIALAIAAYDDRPKTGRIDFAAFRRGLNNGVGNVAETAD